jgi:hypothetical protein
MDDGEKCFSFRVDRVFHRVFIIYFFFAGLHVCNDNCVNGSSICSTSIVGDSSQLNDSEIWPVIVGSVAGVLLCFGAIGIAAYCALGSRSTTMTNSNESHETAKTTTTTTTTITTTTTPQSSIYKGLSIPATNSYVDMPMQHHPPPAEYITLGLTSNDTEYLSFVDRPQSNDDYRQDFLMAGEK